MVTNIAIQLDETGYWKKSRLANAAHSGGPCTPEIQTGTRRNTEMISHVDGKPRFLIWIDEIGGFLVCPKEEIRIGQAVPDSTVDIPVLGDLAREHLKLIRTNQGYLLDTNGYVEVNGRQVDSQVILKNDDRMKLTGGIELRFTSTHPLSASARLDFLSSHRTQPWSDAVLLMAESCVLGPGQKNHVVCHHWQEDLVFFQKNDRFFCKSMSPITVDGEEISGKCEIQTDSQIIGEDFTMKLEPIAT